MFFNLKNLAWIANVMLLFWTLWHVAFMRGYEDAVNDLDKKGYRFEETSRAFK